MVVGLAVAVLAVHPVWWLAGGGRALGPGWWLVSGVGWYVLTWALWVSGVGFWWGWGCCVMGVLCLAEGRARARCLHHPERCDRMTLWMDR
jgi:hypothetical protein